MSENIDVFHELATDLLTVCELGMDQAEKIVAFLHNEGFVDYDFLKEYYLGDPDWK
jgi:hypothetical protein